MKEKLAIIRNIVEKLSAPTRGDSKDHDDLVEALNEELDSLDMLADHIDSYDGYDLESWTEELLQTIEEIKD